MLLNVCFFLWGIAVVYVNYLAATYASKRVLLLQDKPLPDILHDVFPKLYNKHVPDYLLLLCIVYTFFNYTFFNCKVHNIDVFILLCSLSLRPIFICLTTFPSCNEEEEEKNPSLYCKLFLSKHDLMFSGHTCCFLFFGSVIRGTLGSCVSWFFPLSLVAARQHYTIDIVVAMLVYQHIHSIFSHRV